MKKTFSIEFKIMIAVTTLLLALATAVVVKQVFSEDREEVKFVYNSTSPEEQLMINNYDIFSQK